MPQESPLGPSCGVGGGRSCLVPSCLQQEPPLGACGALAHRFARRLEPLQQRLGHRPTECWKAGRENQTPSIKNILEFLDIITFYLHVEHGPQISSENFTKCFCILQSRLTIYVSNVVEKNTTRSNVQILKFTD